MSLLLAILLSCWDRAAEAGDRTPSSSCCSPATLCQLWGYVPSLQHRGEMLPVTSSQNHSVCTAKPENAHRTSQVKMDGAGKHPCDDNGITHSSRQPGRQPWVLILLPTADSLIHAGEIPPASYFLKAQLFLLPRIDPGSRGPHPARRCLLPRGQREALRRGMPGPADSC